MRALGLLAACAALAACAGLQVKPNGLKHVVAPTQVGPGFEQSALPGAFEQSFCTAVFEFNDKLVVCPDELRAMIRLEKQRAMLGAQESAMPDIGASLDAQRKVSIALVQVLDKVRVTVAVADASGKILGRFEQDLHSEGRDVNDKARELAAQVVSLPR